MSHYGELAWEDWRCGGDWNILYINGVFMFLLLRKNQYYQIGRRKLAFLVPCSKSASVLIASCAALYCDLFRAHFFTGMIGKLGTLAIAAHSIALTAEKAFYIPGYGMQAAAATLAGTEAGRSRYRAAEVDGAPNDRNQSCDYDCAQPVVVFLPCTNDVTFTPDEQVIAEGARVLRIVALSEPLFVIAVIVEEF